MKAFVKATYFLGGTMGPTLELINESGDKILLEDGSEVYAALNHESEVEDAQSQWELWIFTEEHGVIQRFPMAFKGMVDEELYQESYQKLLNIQI